jgi:hypothetical protein
MSHPSYAKGYRAERKALAWLAHLGDCTRSFMSRGSDLKLLRQLRYWTFSVKCRAKLSDLTVKQLVAECEGNDFCIFSEDRGIQYAIGPLPKLVEFCGSIEIAEPIE